MIINTDAITALADMDPESIQTCITSPPYYGLRNYGGGDWEIGNEPSPEDYIEQLQAVMKAVHGVLKADGTLWINLGDTMRKGGLLGIPWRVALALQADGWILKNAIVWAKPNPMPESCTNRFTRSYEHVFLFAIGKKYKFNQQKEAATYAGAKRGGSTNRYEQNSAGMDAKVYDTRNMRDVWSIRPASLSGAHFAVFPENLVEPCVLAGSDEGDLVLDPFCGSATAGVVAQRLGREFIGIELVPEYAELARKRLAGMWRVKRPTQLQKWHGIYQQIAEHLETDDHDKIVWAHDRLQDALHHDRSQAHEYNSALIAIAQKFNRANPKRWIREAAKAECPDQIPGFDEAVLSIELAPEQYRIILGPEDSIEDQLFSAVKGGLMPIPTLRDSSAWEALDALI